MGITVATACKAAFFHNAWLVDLGYYQNFSANHDFDRQLFIMGCAALLQISRAILRICHFIGVIDGDNKQQRMISSGFAGLVVCFLVDGGRSQLISCHKYQDYRPLNKRPHPTIVSAQCYLPKALAL